MGSKTFMTEFRRLGRLYVWLIVMFGHSGPYERWLRDGIADTEKRMYRIAAPPEITLHNFSVTS